MQNELSLLLKCLQLHMTSQQYANYPSVTTFSTNTTGSRTIYHKRNRAQSVIILVAGGFNFRFSSHVRKLVDLLYSSQYDWLIYEDVTQFNMRCISQVTQWISSTVMPNYRSLTLIGISNGGIIASRILYTLTRQFPHHTYKLITIDSPYDNDQLFRWYEDNCTVCRFDIMHCYVPAYWYSIANKYINGRLDDIVYLYDRRSAAAFFKRVYGMCTRRLRKDSTVTYNLPNCHIYRLYSKSDPIVIYSVTDHGYQHVKPHPTTKITNIELYPPSHAHVLHIFTHPEILQSVLQPILSNSR